MKNINAKKVLMFDENIMYAFNNLTPSHRLPLRQVRKGWNLSIELIDGSRISSTSLFIREQR